MNTDHAKVPIYPCKSKKIDLITEYPDCQHYAKRKAYSNEHTQVTVFIENVEVDQKGEEETKP